MLFIKLLCVIIETQFITLTESHIFFNNNTALHGLPNSIFLPKNLSNLSSIVLKKKKIGKQLTLYRLLNFYGERIEPQTHSSQFL